MHDNRVSEKAVWEGSITHDDEVPFTAPQGQNQPQMMFCYKCNNVIPGDSKYCPYCQVELFVTCPKCGAKYSSQYPSCSQCGTNRQDYLQIQRREQERKAAAEREERIRLQKLEWERQEQKRKEALESQRHEDYRRKLSETYERQKEYIVSSQEYKSTYSVLKEALESYRWKNLLYLLDVEKREQYILQYIKKKNCDYDKEILDYVVKIIRDPFYKYTYDVLENLSIWCIEAYKKHKRLPSL